MSAAMAALVEVRLLVGPARGRVVRYYAHHAARLVEARLAELVVSEMAAPAPVASPAPPATPAPEPEVAPAPVPEPHRKRRRM
jgi:hypothetical protein